MKEPIVSLHDQGETDDSKVSFMTMDEEGNVVDIFGREYSTLNGGNLLKGLYINDVCPH